MNHFSIKKWASLLLIAMPLSSYGGDHCMDTLKQDKDLSRILAARNHLRLDPGPELVLSENGGEHSFEKREDGERILKIRGGPLKLGARLSWRESSSGKLEYLELESENKKNRNTYRFVQTPGGCIVESKVHYELGNLFVYHELDWDFELCERALAVEPGVGSAETAKRIKKWIQEKHSPSPEFAISGLRPQATVNHFLDRCRVDQKTAWKNYSNRERTSDGQGQPNSPGSR